MSNPSPARAPLILAALSLSVLISGTAVERTFAQTAVAPAQPRIVVQSPAAAAAAPAAPRPAAAAAPAAAGPALRPVVQSPQAAAPAGVAAPAAAAAAGASAAPTPRIIVIDRAFILQRSSAGRDMVAQLQNLSKQADTQFRTEEAALQTEAQTLQQQMAIMAADVREQKEKDFIAKQQAFQGRVQQRQAEMQAGFGQATRQLEMALEPILQNIMRERGANMVLDRASVLLASIDIDVTPVAVQRLDKDLPRVKVELVKLPPGAVPVASGGPGAAGRSPVVAGAPGRR